MFGFDDIAGAIGGAVGGGMNLVGGLLGAAQNRQSMRAGYDFQRDVLKNQLKWRMADARGAGLHPLAAMGMMPSSSQPVAIGGDVLAESMSRAGQSFSSGFNAAERALEKAQIGLLESQKRNIDEQTADIVNARVGPKVPGQVNIMPEVTGEGVLPAGQAPAHGFEGPFIPYVNAPPPTVIPYGSRGPGIETGVQQDLVEVQTGVRDKQGNYFSFLGPAGLKQESHHELIGELPDALKLSLILRNQAYWSKHGYDNWWNDALKVASGLEPDGPIKSTHSGQIPPSVFGSLMGAFEYLKPKAERVYDYATNEASAYMNRYKKWSKGHPSGRR